MGFLDRVFGQREPKELTLKLSDVEPFFEKETQKKRNALEKDVQAKLAEAKHLINEMAILVRELDKQDVAEGDNKRLRKIVITSKQGFISRFNNLLKKVGPPSVSSLEEAGEYVKNTKAILRKDVFSLRKNIAYTGILLKEKIKLIGKNLDEFNALINDLDELFKKNDSIVSPPVKSLLAEINSAMSDEKDSKGIMGQRKKEIAQIEKEISQKRGSILKIKDSEECSSLNELMEEKNALENERAKIRQNVLGVFSSVEKPLKKMQNMVERKEYFPGEKQGETLLRAIESPLKMLKADPKAVSFKELLSLLKKEIKSEKIVLKDAEKRLKAIDNAIEFNFVDEFFWKENNIEKKLSEIEKKLAQNTAKKRLSIAEKELITLENELDGASKEVRRIESSSGGKTEMVEEKIQILSQLLSNASGKRVSVEI